MSLKKKILYISLRSGFGGATMHVDQLIRSFSNDYDIYCAAPVEEPYGVKLLDELGREKYFVLPYRSFSIRYWIRLIFFIKRNKIDILHAHGKGAGIYARLAKLFTPKVCLIYTFHGLHISHYSKLMKRFYILLERILGKFTNQFINVSDGEKQDCLENKLFKESKSTVIHNAVERNTELKLTREELRHKLDLPANKFIVISVVRFNLQKNVWEILEIAKKFTSNQNILFLIIGDGEEKELIEKKINEDEIKNIRLTGYKKNVYEYLHSSDIFLSTSLWEGLPYSLIEAVQAGLPVVASNVTGNNEVVTNNFNGYLFDLNDRKKAIESILELFSSPVKRELFGRNSKKVFDGKFQLESMLSKTKKVYSRCC